MPAPSLVKKRQKICIMGRDFLSGPAVRTANAGDWGSIPDQGTRFPMPQLKISHATTKTRSGQINIINRNNFFFKKYMVSNDWEKAQGQLMACW